MNLVANIANQYCEEAGFLWLRRTLAVGQPQFDLKSLAKLDHRLEAHLDGLRVAGDAGWEACRNALELEGPGEVFAAAVIAFGSAMPDRIQAVLSVAGASRERSRAVASALGWLAQDAVLSHIRNLSESQEPLLRRGGLAGAAIHRVRPENLAGEIDHVEPLVRARACRAAGELGATDQRYVLANHLRDEDGESRFWAAWSLATMGSPDAQPVLSTIAAAGTVQSEPAATMLARVTGHVDLAGTRAAVKAAGASGDPSVIPYLFEQMANPALSRVAAEAFATITGVNLIFENLGTPRAEGVQPGPNENPDDEDVSMDPDDHLPWPSTPAVAQWWDRHQASFRTGTRYLAGKPIADEWLSEVLRGGYQRQRVAASLELTIRHPAEPMFEVRAPGFRQELWLVSQAART